MKVLMALDYYRPNVSGLSLFVERLARELAARGQKITILTHRHQDGLPLEEQEGAVRIRRAPVLLRVGKALLSPALVKLAAREIAVHDVVHLHAPLVPAVPLAALCAAEGVPFVVTYHCDLVAPPGLFNRFVETVARASQNFALDRAARVVTYTKDYATHTEPLSERPESAAWILPPVPDPPLPTSSPGEIRRALGVSGSPVILFLGRFAEEKGLNHLLSAFDQIRRRFPEASLLLAGEKDAVPGERVGERLSPLLSDPSSGIVATGLVAPERVPELFSVADVLVLPSTNSTESFGLVQVEGMLCGVPSVASDLPGVRQPVRLTGMGEVARVGDPKDLAEKISKVLESPSSYRRDRAFVRAAFSLSDTVERYEATYRQVLGSSR